MRVFRDRNKKNQFGMTLVEIMIYIFIAGTIASVFGYFVIDMLFSRSRNVANLEVQENTRLIFDRLVNEIRHAKSIDTTSSVFDTNLALSVNEGKILRLIMSSSTLSPTEFDVLGGIVRIRQGAGATATPLSASSTEVTSLIFRNYSSKKARAIGVEMTAIFRGAIPGQTVGVTSTMQTAVTLMNR